MAKGELDLRPTISVTKSHLDMPEIKAAVKEGRLTADGVHLTPASYTQCIVEGCSVSLVVEKPYYRRFGVCQPHMQALELDVSGEK